MVLVRELALDLQWKTRALSYRYVNKRVYTCILCYIACGLSTSSKSVHIRLVPEIVWSQTADEDCRTKA
jgi:hypothetical protein